MNLPAAGESARVTELNPQARVLRSRWRTASLASGWRFPSDWELPEVDTVCSAACAHGVRITADVETALAGLAGARARTGSGLTETLTDVAALHAVFDRRNPTDGLVAPDVDAVPARLVRIVALAWAETALDNLSRTEATDSLTGLATLAYLRTRLAELYRGSAPGTAPSEHGLLVVRLDLAAVSGWCRLIGMILAADALRTTFRNGESLAATGPSTVVALVRHGVELDDRTLELRRSLTERLSSDRHLVDVGAPDIRLHSLPTTHDSACRKLDRLARG